MSARVLIVIFPIPTVVGNQIPKPIKGFIAPARVVLAVAQVSFFDGVSFLLRFSLRDLEGWPRFSEPEDLDSSDEEDELLSFSIHDLFFASLVK